MRNSLLTKIAVFVFFSLMTLSSLAINYYVNDASTAGDLFCSAVGNPSNNGLSASTPKASLAALLTAYGSTGTKVLKSGDIIYVDAGNYVGLDKDLTISYAGISIVGAGMHKTIFDNSNGDNSFLKIRASNVKLQDFQITNYAKSSLYAKAIDITTAAYTGITVERVQVSKNSAALGLFPIEISGGSSVVFNGGGVACNIGVAGGGVQIAGSTTTVTFNDYVFYGNNRNASGGAIRVQAGVVTVNNSLFSNNTLEKDITGSAIYVSTGTVTINNSKFTDNYTNLQAASTTGGDILVAGGTLNVKKSIFQNHRQSGPGFSWGAGVGSTAGTISIDSCIFSNNYGSTTRGMHVYNSGGKLTLSNSMLLGDDGVSNLIGNNSGTFTVVNSGSLLAYKGTTAVTFTNTTATSLNLTPSLPDYSGDCSTGIQLLCKNTAVTYAASSKCNVGILTPTFTPAGGVFSSTAGLSIDPTTGVVNLETSKPSSSYLISYNTPGCLALFNLFVGGKIDTLKLSGTTTINVGDSTKLISNVTPKNFYDGNWSSSNTGVAYVGNPYRSTVFGFKEGTTTITFTLKGEADCPNAVASSIVNVVPKTTAGIISGVSSICLGANTTLTSNQSGGFWLVSDVNIANIDSLKGIISGKNPGKITVYYKIIGTQGSQDLISTKQFEIMSNVPVPLTTNLPTGVCVGSSANLWNNSGATGVWSSLHPSIATINSSGVVTGVSDGLATIQFVTNKNGTCSDSISTISVKVFSVFPDNIITGPTNICLNTFSKYSTPYNYFSTASSDTTVISMAGHNATGKKVGTSTISFTLSNLGLCKSKVVSMNVTVISLSSSIKISGEPVICTNCNTYLKTSDPSIKGSWYSSNPSVATIDTISGKVVGIKYDTVTIFYRIPAIGICPVGSKSYRMKIELINDFLMIKGIQTVEIGKTVTYSTSYSGKTQNKHWFSCDTTIATVDAKTGVVTGKGIGTTNIVCAIGNNNYLDTISNKSITVIYSSSHAVLGGNEAMCIGSTNQMTASLPGGIWSTTNSSIITVNSSGLVTSLAGGSANILYTIRGTNSLDSVASKSITVYDKPTNNGLSANQQICLGDTTSFRTTSPGGVWASMDTLVAKVASNGVINSLKSGDVLIKYTVRGLGGCRDSSRTAKLTISTYPMPYLQITSSAINNTINATDTVIFSTTQNNLGTYPTYVWTVNGIVKNNATTETTKINTLKNNDTVQLKVVSNANCTSGGWKQITTYSNKIITNVNSLTKSSLKEITSFIFVNPSSTGVISGNNIALTVPAGTNVTNLIANFSVSPKATVKVGVTTQVSGQTANNFTSPVSYIVTAEDGTTKNYTVTVQVAASVKSSACELLTFGITSPLRNATITGTTITVNVPGGTNLTTLIPTFTLSNGASLQVNSVSQVSGVTVNDFTKPLNYTVIAEDGLTTKSYVVIVYKSTVLWSSDFTNPSDWGINTKNYTGAINWQITSTMPTSSRLKNWLNGVGNVFNTTSKGNFALVDPSASLNAYSTFLTTKKPINTLGVNSVQLLFNQLYMRGTDTAKIEVSTDSLNWTSFRYNNKYTANQSSLNPENVRIDISALAANKSSVWIRFNQTGAGDGTDFAWFVDDVSIESFPSLDTTNLTKSSANDFISFSLSNPSVIGQVFSSGPQVRLLAPAGTDLTKAILNFQVSSGATVYVKNVKQVSGVSTINVSSAYYDVVAEDGSTKTYLVQVSFEPAILSGQKTLCVNSNSQLTANVPGFKTGLTWFISDTSIAKITVDGLVTAIKQGKCFVTFYDVNGSKTNDTITVLPTSITSAGSITGKSDMCMGEVVAFSETNQGGFWSSSDTTIATIDRKSGQLTAKSDGQSLVSYTIPGTSMCNLSVSNFKIVVHAPLDVLPIEGVTTFCKNSSTNLSSQTNLGTWESNNTSVASVDANGKVFGLSAGTSKITYTVSQNGCTSATSTNVEIIDLPSIPAITGNTKICTGSSEQLSNALKGGVWLTNDSSVVMIDSNGVMTPVKAGVSEIIYRVTENGCTSYRTIVAYVKNASTSTESKTACTSYTWNNQTYTQSGVYTYTTNNKVGCDSVASLDLTIVSVLSYSEKQTACGEYTWHGTTYKQSGTYVDTLKTSGGCDSIVTLYLTISPKVAVTETKVSCGSYIWHGKTYSQSGSYVDTMKTQAGCDSIVTLNLTIKSVSTSTASVTACGSYTWNKKVYTKSGVYTFSTKTAEGCDSIAILNLTMGNGVYLSETKNACGSYTWHGKTYTQSGTYVDSLKTPTGCDSIVTLNLKLQQAVQVKESKTTCGAYTWHGKTYTQSGMYVDSLKTTIGCDSLVTLDLTIAPVLYGTETKVTCNDFVWHGKTYSKSGTFVDTLKTTAGCDSVVTLKLQITPVVSSTETKVTCSAFTWHDKTFAQSGSYVDTMKTQAGCDSIVTLNLTIKSVSTSTENIATCGSYVWNKQTYVKSGIYTYPTKTKEGCDSIAILNLTIHTAVSSTVTKNACESYTWHGKTFNQSGTYVDTLKTTIGCDSIVTLKLTINKGVTTTESKTACGLLVWHGKTYSKSGTYMDTLKTTAGCDSIVTLNLTVNPIPEIASILGDTSITVGSTSPLTVSTPSGIWSSVDASIAEITAQGVVTGVKVGTTLIRYEVTANGCMNAKTIQVVVAAKTDTATTGLQTVYASGMEVFPNPFVDKVHITLDQVGDYQIQVYDLTGKLLTDTKHEHTKEIIVNLEHIASGEYVLKVIHDQFVETRKLTK